LSVTSSGAITQSGALSVQGNATFDAGATNDITLNNVGNVFNGGVGITSGRNVQLRDSNALVLRGSTISGSLDVTAGGPIPDQTGVIFQVAGPATFAAGAGNDITLNNTLNDFSSVAITSGRHVVLVDTNSIALAASTVSGNLGITASGAVDFAGVSTVG